VKLKLTSVDLIIKLLPILQIMKISLHHIQHNKHKKIFDESYEKLQQIEMNKIIMNIKEICSTMEKVKEDFGLREKIDLLDRYLFRYNQD
jgi:hypothetical protein